MQYTHLNTRRTITLIRSKLARSNALLSNQLPSRPCLSAICLPRNPKRYELITVVIVETLSDRSHFSLPWRLCPFRVQQIKTIEILKPSFLRAYKENQVDEYFTRAANLWCERFPDPEPEITTRAYKDDPEYLIFVNKLRKEVR